MRDITSSGFVIIADTRAFALDRAAMKAWRKRWPNFMPWELDSDDFSLRLLVKALDSLQAVRTAYGRPMRVTCAYRNPFHNQRVGGKENSQHLLGTAFDIVVNNRPEAESLERLFTNAGFTAIGRYPSRFFMHIDMRPAKPSGKLYQWGRKWSYMSRNGGGGW